MNLHLVKFWSLLNHDVYLLLEGFFVIAAFILLQFIRPSLLANGVNYHEVYLIEAFPVPPFADDILPLFLELPDKVSLHHQARNATVVSADDGVEGFQGLVLHKCLILEEEAEPENQETVIELVANFLAADLQLFAT